MRDETVTRSVQPVSTGIPKYSSSMTLWRPGPAKAPTPHYFDHTTKRGVPANARKDLSTPRYEESQRFKFT